MLVRGGVPRAKHVLDGQVSLRVRRLERVQLRQVGHHALVQPWTCAHVPPLLEEQVESHEAQPELLDRWTRGGRGVLSHVAVDHQLVDSPALRSAVRPSQQLAVPSPAA